MTHNRMITETILQQLGGGRFVVMTGASNVAEVDRGVAFKLPYRMARNGINHVKIVLDADDTYTVQFLKLTRSKLYTSANVSGVHCENLQEVFTRYTGLYTHL